MSKKIVEYRGCKGLVFAEVTTDNNGTGTGDGYVTGAVKDLAGVAEISKNVSLSRVSKYYDNVAAIVVSAEGEDVVTLTISIPSMEVQAAVNGRVYDSTRKMYIECPIVNKYYAVGYIIEDTDGTEYYVWRHKGYFMQPDETSATQDDGTDGNNMSLEYHGIYTIHEFTNGGGTGVKKPVKSFKMANDGTLDLSTFFATVTTPDTTFSAPTP